MTDEIKITIRLPAVLHEDLVSYANDETRSLNSAIIVLLREALKGYGPYDDRTSLRKRRR